VLIGLAERAATSIPPDPRTALQAALLAKRENGSPSKVKRALNLSIESSLSRTFHLDGPIVGVSVSRNNIVALATAKQVLVLDRVAQPVLRLTSEGPVADVALSRDGTRLLVVHEDRPVEIWSLPEGKGLWSTPFFSAQPVAAVSPDGSLVALYDAKRRLLCLWSIAMRRQIWSKYTLLTRVYFAPNSDQVISMEPNGAVVVWSVAQGERRSFALHHESIKAISFNEPDSLCLTTSDGVAVLWDRHRVQKRNEFPAKGGGWYAGVISPLTEAIVLANDANGLRVVDYTGNADAAKGLLGRTPAQFLAFSTKGTLAAGYLDGTLRTWHLPSSGPTPAAEIPTGRHVPFSMIAFGDDSLVAASGEYAFVVDANAYERYQKQGVDLAAFAMDRLPLYDSSIKRISH
jgi:WD40 repeat protein